MSASAPQLWDLVVASCCAACQPEWLPGAKPTDLGFMAIMHAAHAPELQAAGWIRTPAEPGEPDDLACPHYHAEHWGRE